MTEIHFVPRRMGKISNTVPLINWALSQGKRAALMTPLGIFVVPAGYQLATPVVGPRWSLRTPEGMLVRYRIKPKR